MPALLPSALSAVLPKALRRCHLGLGPELPRPVTRAIPPVVGLLGRVPGVGDLLTQQLVNYFGYAAPPRPHPFSLAADYTTWPSLIDRRWSGRHLPAGDPATALPPEADVVDLFRREAFRPSEDTSALFALFAQWFTDSFLRTDPDDYRRNFSTHEIDLCQIYGRDEHTTTLLRGRVGGGRLASQEIDGQEWPPFLLERDGAGGWRVRERFAGLHDERYLFDRLLPPVSDEHKATYFAVGLPQGNSTVGKTALTTIMLREHNRIAAAIARAHPEWDDERLFQTTRTTMVVLMITLVVGDYIRHIAPFDLPLRAVPGLADRERWDRTNRTHVEFNLLYRWHSLVPDTVTLGGRETSAAALVDNNPLVLDHGIEALTADLSRSRAGRIGLRNTPAFLLDVEALTVGLAREARLRSLNDYRAYFGLRRHRSFADLTADAGIRRSLAAFYPTVDDVEWYVGIWAEDYPSYWMMGELMTTMVAYDAFTQALTNPLLDDQVYGAATFSATGLEVLETTSSLEQVVARNVADPARVHVSFSC